MTDDPLRIVVRPLGVVPPEGEGDIPGLDIGGSFDALAAAVPGNSSALVSGMVERARRRQVAEAERWLLDTIGPPPSQGGSQVANVPGAATTTTPASAATASAATAESGGLLDKASAVGRDVARGVVEAPRQILGGMRDAAQAAINLGDWLADNLEAIAPLGGFQLFNDKGEFSPERIPAGDPRLAADKTGGALPDVKKPSTVTGGLVRAASQFLTGFASGAGVIGGATTFPRAAVAGALADFGAFDGHEKRLSDLVEQVPALKNPVTEFLASKPGEGEIEGRLKRAIEGLGLGAAAEGVFRGIRYVRDARRAAEAVDPEIAAAREMKKPRAAQDLSLLGDEAAPLVGRRQSPAAREAELGVPDDVAARALTPKGLTPLGDADNPVFVNFARINAAEDVKKVIADTANAFRGDIDAARRGVRTNVQTINEAGAVDAWQTLLSRREGAGFNAEEAVAVRGLWNASATKLLEIAEIAARTGTPEDLFQFRKMLAIHGTIQREVVAGRTETARALQSWAIPVGSPAERLKSIDNLLITYGGRETAITLAERVAALKNVPNGMAALEDMVEKGVFAKSVGAAKELWINALLSNPKTHVVNMMGNTAALATEFVERFVASRYSQLLGSADMAPGEAAAKMYGAAMGVREGLVLFGKALRTGESQFGAQTSKIADAGFDKAISAGYWGIPAENWMAKAVDGLGFMANQPTRWLGAEDDFFKAVGYRAEVQALAFREASAELAAGKIERGGLNQRAAELAANPPEHIHMDALDAAAYQTFTKTPGTFVQMLNGLDRKWMEGSPGEQLSSFALRMLIPFRNTPANLMKYAFERTPLALLMQNYREAVARGGADADIAVTRMAMGSFVLLGVMDFALEGNITGGGPRGGAERGTRQTQERAGWQPYSLKIGDRYYSYKRTDPIGLTFGIAADIAEVINNAKLDEDKREQISDVVMASIASFGAQVLDRSYMSSISDSIDALRNPNKAGPFIERLLTGFEPAAVGEVRRQVDPYMRYSHDLTTMLRNKTPGLSEDLPLQRDMWGRTRSFQSGMGQLCDALSPIASKRINPEPIDREAMANDFNLMMPDWSIPFGTGVRVSSRNRPEVYSRYLELRGQVRPSDMFAGAEAKTLAKRYGDVPLLELLNDIVEGRHKLSEEYAAAGGGRSGGKDEMVSRIVRDYGSAARAGLTQEFPELAGVVAKKREKREASR